MKERVYLDHLIVGGGVVGLYVAKLISKKFKNEKICLLESSDFLGDQSTGRNSGVLHSGLYYKTDSLKHLYSVEGNRKWKLDAKKYNFPIRNIGKYIFSSDYDSLERIYLQAKKNSVTGIYYKSVKEINSFVNARFALFSDTTAILSVPEVIVELERIIESRGVIILKNHKVLNLNFDNEFIVEFDDFIIITKRFYNLAGLGAITIRKMLNLTDLDDYFVKGMYLKSSQSLNYPALLYPLPEKNLLGLGIHSTVDFNDDIKFGPNIQITDSINYKLNNELILKMKDEVCAIYKNLDKNKLYGDYAGIRSKILFNNKVYDDFWIKSPLLNYFEACGIDSPGLTSAPIIAQSIVDLIEL